jgi:hypothetical protein
MMSHINLLKKNFRTTQELEFIYFLSRKAQFFFQNLTLGYMTKTLNQIFFPPPKSEYFFQQHWHLLDKDKVVF